MIEMATLLSAVLGASEVAYTLTHSEFPWPRQEFVGLYFEIIIKSFTQKKYSNETELWKHVRHLKQSKTDFTIKCKTNYLGITLTQ